MQASTRCPAGHHATNKPPVSLRLRCPRANTLAVSAGAGTPPPGCSNHAPAPQPARSRLRRPPSSRRQGPGVQHHGLLRLGPDHAAAHRRERGDQGDPGQGSIPEGCATSLFFSRHRSSAKSRTREHGGTCGRWPTTRPVRARATSTWSPTTGSSPSRSPPAGTGDWLRSSCGTPFRIPRTSGSPPGSSIPILPRRRNPTTQTGTWHSPPCGGARTRS